MLDISENIKLQLQYMPELMEQYQSFRQTDVSSPVEAPVNPDMRLIFCNDYAEVMEVLHVDEWLLYEAVLEEDHRRVLQLMYHPSRKGLDNIGEIPVLYTQSALCSNTQPMLLVLEGCILLKQFVSSAAIIFLLRKPDVFERLKLKHYNGTIYELENADKLTNYLLDSGKYKLTFTPRKVEQRPVFVMEWNCTDLILSTDLSNKLEKSNTNNYKNILCNTTMDVFNKVFFTNLANEYDEHIDVTFVKNLIAVDELHAAYSKIQEEFERKATKYAQLLAKADIVDFQTTLIEYAHSVEIIIKDNINCLRERILQQWQSFLQ